MRGAGGARSRGEAPSEEEVVRHGVAFVGVGLLSFALLALALAAFVLPPAFAAGLILHGGRALRIAGCALGGAWLVGVMVVGRRVMAPRSRGESD